MTEKTWPELSENEHYQKALIMLNEKLNLKRQEISEQNSVYSTKKKQ